VLVPFAKDFLVKVKAGERRVEMVLPAGLLDVNRS
jgi:16S rRNA processing protein RimM